MVMTMIERCHQIVKKALNKLDFRQWLENIPRLVLSSRVKQKP